jgi:hypothetical protein
MRYKNPVLFCACFLLLILAGSCKKNSTPAVSYSYVPVSISLIDYNFGSYTAGSWSLSTRVLIKNGATIIDSLTNMYGSYNSPMSGPITNACTQHLNTITHTFKIQSGILNSMEFSDQNGLRITYDLNPTSAYFVSVSDTTTSYCPNTNCRLSVFPVR